MPQSADCSSCKQLLRKIAIIRLRFSRHHRGHPSPHVIDEFGSDKDDSTPRAYCGTASCCSLPWQMTLETAGPEQAAGRRWQGREERHHHGS
ncbi:hypothetical protein ACP70R_012964 [Stipagrostis hirtigluma subsp. patula]